MLAKPLYGLTHQYGERVVHHDSRVEVEAAYYGAPPGWIGHMVRVQWDELFVRLLDPKTGQLLREHVRQKRGLVPRQPQGSLPANSTPHFPTDVAREARTANTSARFAMSSTAGKQNWVCAVSSAFSRG